MGHARAGPEDRRVTRYVLLWAAAGATMALASALLDVPGITDRPTDPVLVVLLGAAAVVLGLVHVRVPRGDTVEGTTLTEAAFVPIMVLLPPPLAIAVAAAGALVSEPIISRWDPRKSVFNVSWVAVSVGTGSWVHHLLAGGAFESRPRALGAALLAATVFVALNLAAFCGLLATRSRRSWRSALAEEAPSSATLNLGVATTGVLVAALVVHAPLTLPVLLVPVALQAVGIRLRGEDLEQLARERSRFERTVDGSSDGIVLIGPDGRVEVWNPRMADLTGVTPEDARGRRPEQLLGADLPTIATPSGEATRLRLADRIVDVRSSAVAVPGTDRTDQVLSFRDVSREAELAQMREDLVMRVSHEIRTPLTTLSGFLETLDSRWERLNDEQRRDLIDAAGRGAQRLSTLVENLMAWARFERRGAAPDATVTPLQPILTEVAADVPRADLEVAADPALTVAMAAADLRTVVRNLVDNAVVYGAPPIVIAASAADGRVELSITDAGPGVPDDAVAALYEPFEQVSRGLTRTAKGLGMGLAVVRAMVTQAGGGIAYESPPAGGARFVVTLPTGRRGSGVTGRADPPSHDPGSAEHQEADQDRQRP